MTHLRSLIVLLLAVAQMVIGFFPGLLGAGSDVGAMVEPYRTPLVPAGWAFAIWGLLYIGCLVFAVFHLMNRRDACVARVGWLAALSFLGTTLWVPHQLTYGPGWASFIGLEWILLTNLAATFAIRLDPRRGAFRGLAYGAIIALAGWITVASPAGLSLALVYENGWDLGDDRTGAVFPILLAWLPIAWGLTWLIRSWFYVVPIMWGLFGVAMANQAEQQFFIGVLALATSFAGLTLFARKHRVRGPEVA
ncbi:hypothetical protein [Parvularcula mediterranea]|uniref:hypothetical protein n=1 Tax=Parvularcula mediterranea TaxID=2732508 RepID=UPI001E452786|nr:hypothetical protein [Parvularcula mediterranea]